MESSSCDLLWRQIMRHMTAQDESSQSKWQAVMDDSPMCDHCQEPGGGALLRCHSEKCTKWFHLDCAFHPTQQGLSLDENGILSFQCKTHFKHTVFCHCKKKYDNTKPMVCCDDCGEWLHHKCEGLDPKATENLDIYTCSKCQALLADGRSYSDFLSKQVTYTVLYI